MLLLLLASFREEAPVLNIIMCISCIHRQSPVKTPDIKTSKK